MTGVGPQPRAELPEPGLGALAPESYGLTLFVSGASNASAQAIAHVREICDAHLSGRHQLRIVDLNQEPAAAAAAQHNVRATPTLVRDHPLPTCMLVGDMSDHVKVLLALGVTVLGGPSAAVAQQRAT
jgi:circadian clock protein KaiB